MGFTFYLHLLSHSGQLCKAHQFTDLAQMVVIMPQEMAELSRNVPHAPHISSNDTEWLTTFVVYLLTYYTLNYLPQ
jgi:hypothetical protein